MELVSAALEQAPETRESYLRSACSHDSDLYCEVEERVLWEERMEGFMTQSVIETLELLDRPFELGELVAGRFRLLNEVGRGGMGIVYEAYDQKLDRRVAMKIAVRGHDNRLPPEARAAREVSHFNVCKVYELHSTQAKHREVEFLVMEFIEGETLSARLRRAGPLPPEQHRDIARQICAGLAQAHRQGVVHGDLKSGNIILTLTPEGGTRAVITDFGLASFHAPGDQELARGPLRGSVDYMAPELFSGVRPSTASDLYALGVVLHEMLTGKTPAPAKDSTLAQNASTLTLPQAFPRRAVQRRCQKLPRPWRAIVARCLEVLPEARFSSAEEIIDGLDTRQDPRKWLMAVPAIAAVAVIAAAIVGAFNYTGMAPQENVQLAVLPFETDAGHRSISDGLLDEASKQLRRVKGSRMRFTVIPLSDALQNKVDRPEKAAKLLGATHILTGRLRWDGGRALVQASLVDAQSHLPLKEWSGEYQVEKLRDMPIALAGMVTGTLRLPPLAAAQVVNAVAYADFTSGVGLLQRNSVDSALPLLERAVKADADSPLTHARLAEAQILKYQLTNDATWLNRAIVSLGNARQHNPDVAEVWFVSGMINASAGAYETARDDLRRGLEIEPQNGAGWRHLGRIYRESNHFTDALAAYQKGVEVQPGHFQNYQGLCSLYSDSGNYQEGIPQCLKLVAMAPDFPAAHLQLAVAYGNWGRYVEAEAESRVALKLDPTSALAFQVLATALAFQGRYTESISYSQQAINTGFATHLMYLNLGQTLRWAKLPREADDAYRKGVALAEAELAKNSRNGKIRSRLAYLCARLNERSRAENEAALAQQYSPGSVEMICFLVMTYEVLGERDHALALAHTAPDEALRRLSRSPDMADLRADSRFQLLMKSHQIY